MNPPRAPEVDVLIVGAGLSGIGAACHLKRLAPDRTFQIVEARDRMGGTWDLFQYPGIRSDSDMYTLGFSFKPWSKPKSIADGPSILQYLKETAEEHGVASAVRYGLRAEHAVWSSDDATWTVRLRDARSGTFSETTCRFLYLCAGYYEYEAGYTPDFAGIADFGGRVVHPQKWTPDVDYAGKRVVVIGSGATAVTLVPELAKRAAHVTMLQRSPSYIVSAPARDELAVRLQRLLPAMAAYRLTRWRNILLTMMFYQFCRRWPRLAGRAIVRWAMRQLPRDARLERHFTPAYRPWDQRVCLVPDGDLFDAVGAGQATVVTDTIERFTASGLRLASGAEIPADLVVTATGLKMRMVGGMKIVVDGRAVDFSEALVYRGMMAGNAPNLAFAVGYTNASWTLKVDLVAEYVCRLLNHMRRHGYTSARPVPPPLTGDERPLVDFTSGYVQRAIMTLPKQGKRAPWRLYQNYLVDLLMMRYGRLGAAMEFRAGP